MTRALWMTLVPLLAADRPTSSVTVEVSGLASARGVVECVLWAGPDGFPTDTARAQAKVTARATTQRRATCTFAEVTAGTYAVSVWHDEDEDGVVNRGLFGIPTERYGWSNDPRPLMRAARFDEATFSVDGAPVVVKVTAR
jgi:uncharacterized protein (DUF2141 family)